MLIDVLGVEWEGYGRGGVLGRLLVVALGDNHRRKLGILALGNRLLPFPAMGKDTRLSVASICPSVILPKPCVGYCAIHKLIAAAH